MREDLQVKLKEYMKQKDRVRADTVRSIISAFQYEEMAKKVDALDKDSAIAILQRELKKRKEELEFVEKSGRPELVEKNQIETEVIEALLPQQMNAEALTQLISELKEQLQAKNMGIVMKTLQEKYAGQYDGKTASELAKKLFS
jgi:uncharacterized protein YqeY